MVFRQQFIDPKKGFLLKSDRNQDGRSNCAKGDVFGKMSGPGPRRGRVKNTKNGFFWSHRICKKWKLPGSPA